MSYSAQEAKRLAIEAIEAAMEHQKAGRWSKIGTELEEVLENLTEGAYGRWASADPLATARDRQKHEDGFYAAFERLGRPYEPVLSTWRFLSDWADLSMHVEDQEAERCLTEAKAAIGAIQRGEEMTWTISMC